MRNRLLEMFVYAAGAYPRKGYTADATAKSARRKWTKSVGYTRSVSLQAERLRQYARAISLVSAWSSTTRK